MGNLRFGPGVGREVFEERKAANEASRLAASKEGYGGMGAWWESRRDVVASLVDGFDEMQVIEVMGWPGVPALGGSRNADGSVLAFLAEPSSRNHRPLSLADRRKMAKARLEYGQREMQMARDELLTLDAEEEEANRGRNEAVRAALDDVLARMGLWPDGATRAGFGLGLSDSFVATLRAMNFDVTKVEGK